MKNIFKDIIDNFKCSFLDVHEPNKMFISKKRNIARCSHCNSKIKLLDEKWISAKRFNSIMFDKKKVR